MNRTAKATTIAAGTGVATYVGDIVQWLLEKGIGDMPDNIDAAVTGLTVALVGYLLYKFLPAGDSL